MTHPRNLALVPKTDSDDRNVYAALVLGVLAVVLRYLMAPQLDGLDDAGYLEAAQRVSHGVSLDNMFPLFRTRVGMAYPLGWLLRFDLIGPAQFWILTILADAVTLGALFVGGGSVVNNVHRSGLDVV